MAKIYLSYDTSKLQDGYFAQIQRQLAIYAISKRFKFKYIHSEISNIVNHQIDLFQKKHEIEEFLIKTNPIYKLPSDEVKSLFLKRIFLDTPSLMQIMKFRFMYLFTRGSVLILISNPYRIIEKHIESYKYSCTGIKPARGILSGEVKIVMHIRTGIAKSHITPGESLPRVIGEKYFLSVLKKIVSEIKNAENFKLLIFTDAPEKDEIYKPEKNDLEKWSEFRYRSNSKMDEILVEGHDFSDITNFFKSNFLIIRGGDPNLAVSTMIDADYLIMSRSSMSYVAALLNKSGVIYYPPNFWHKPLKKWVRVANFSDK